MWEIVFIQIFIFVSPFFHMNKPKYKYIAMALTVDEAKSLAELLYDGLDEAAS